MGRGTLSPSHLRGLRTFSSGIFSAARRWRRRLLLRDVHLDEFLTINQPFKGPLAATVCSTSCSFAPHTRLRINRRSSYIIHGPGWEGGPRLIIAARGAFVAPFHLHVREGCRGVNLQSGIFYSSGSPPPPAVVRQPRTSSVECEVHVKRAAHVLIS